MYNRDNRVEGGKGVGQLKFFRSDSIQLDLIRHKDVRR